MSAVWAAMRCMGKALLVCEGRFSEALRPTITKVNMFFAHGKFRARSEVAQVLLRQSEGWSKSPPPTKNRKIKNDLSKGNASWVRRAAAAFTEKS